MHAQLDLNFFFFFKKETIKRFHNEIISMQQRHKLPFVQLTTPCPKIFLLFFSSQRKEKD